MAFNSQRLMCCSNPTCKNSVFNMNMTTLARKYLLTDSMNFFVLFFMILREGGKRVSVYRTRGEFRKNQKPPSFLISEIYKSKVQELYY